MKYNAWTLALISAGVVSLPAVAHAEETTNAVMTALATTTISGYVDTSAHWNPGTGNQNLPLYTPNGQPGGTKADGFNLDLVALTLSKLPGEGDWSAGYNATLLFGPDALGYNNSFGALPSDFSLKDAYVDLHAPLGNGLDIKLGTYTEILGYEVYETGNNPNYTRSYGYAIEPTAMTGVLLGYQLNSAVALSAGICDAWNAGVNARGFAQNPPNTRAESYKTYMASVTFTCPTNFGFLSGSTLSGGVINGNDSVTTADKTSLYIGGTVNTPINNVKVGAAYDYVMLGPNFFNPANANTAPFHQSGYQGAFGLYLSYQATPKLSFYTRGEYFTESGYLAAGGIAGAAASAFEVTQTVQYDLWK